jgi:uncharacterized DUF497 family protein
VELDFDYVDDEPRWVVVGVTNRGRFLVVVFTERGAGLRVVTAYDASKRDQSVYFSKKGN